jgi:hypothetical protein
MNYAEIGMMSRPEECWQDVDAMIEARNAREWEELNEVKELDASEVLLDLDYALDHIQSAKKDLGDAMNEADGFPIKYRIESIFDVLDTLEVEINTLMENLKKEVKSA